MSSGSNFLDLLYRVNYSKASDFKSSDFDWMSNDDSISEFISNICENITEENILTDDELSSYAVLEENSHLILDGDTLQEAIQQAESISNNFEIISIEDERREVERMENKLKLINNNCSVVLIEENRMNLQLSCLNQKHTRLGNLRKETELHFNERQNFSQIHIQVNNCLQILSEKLNYLQSIFTERDASSLFPSSLNFNEFIRMEENFMLSASSFTEKQFHPKINEVSGCNDEFNQDIFKQLHPEVAILITRSVKEQESLYYELNRLLSQLPGFIGQKMILETETEIYQARKQFLVKLSNSLSSHDAKSLNSMLSDFHKTKIADLKAKIQDLKTSGIEKALSQLYELKEYEFLIREQNFQVARQLLLISKLDSVIEILFKPKSRRILLKMVLESDKKNHEETESLLTSVLKKVDREIELFKARSLAINSKLDESKSYNPDLVSEPNLISLTDILEEKGESEKRMLSYNKLISMGKKFKSEVDSTSEAIEKSHKKDVEASLSQNSKLSNCHRMINKTKHQANCMLSIVHSPLEISKRSKEVMRGSAMLGNITDEIMQDHLRNEQKFKLKPDLLEERNLFIKFCNNSKKLSN